MMSLNTYLKSGTTTLSNIVLEYYTQIGMTDKELILYLHLLRFEQKGIYFPDLYDISTQMNCEPDYCFSMVQNMINNGILRINTITNQDGKAEDQYDLTLLFNKIDGVLAQKQNQVKVDSKINKVRTLFQNFEKEFGRALSPMEMETVNQWINEDHYDTELIHLALKEAILNQAYSLKYIDRILLSWDRKNLKTKQAVQADQKKRSSDKINIKESHSEVLPEIPMFNWLNPNDTQ